MATPQEGGDQPTRIPTAYQGGKYEEDMPGSPASKKKKERGKRGNAYEKDREKEKEEDEAIRIVGAYGGVDDPVSIPTKESDSDSKSDKTDSSSDSDSDSSKDSSSWSDDNSSDEESGFAWNEGSLFSIHGDSCFIPLQPSLLSSLEGKHELLRPKQEAQGTKREKGKQKETEQEKEKEKEREVKEPEQGTKREKGKEKEKETEKETEPDQGVQGPEQELEYTDWNKRFQRLLQEKDTKKKYAGLQILEKGPSPPLKSPI